MPKFTKAFGRRKSISNALEDIQSSAPSESISSFKVFERNDHSREKSFDGGVKLARAGRPSSYPLQVEDNIFEDLNSSRGSGISNAYTASTTDQSSRISAASTTPSSTMGNDHQDTRAVHDKPFNDIPRPTIPKSTSGFSLKAAGRTFSFGRPKGTTPPPSRTLDEASSPTQTPPHLDSALNRPRAVTSSSYASTATPPKLEERDLGLSLGGDFSDMFSGFGKRQAKGMDIDTARDMSKSPDYSPSGPAIPPRAINARSNQPSPLQYDRSANVEASPYLWTSRDSSDRLMANTSPVAHMDDYRDSPPPVPRHDTIRKPSPGAQKSLTRSSALAVRRQSTLEYDDSIDEDARLLRESVTASRRMDEPSRTRSNWLDPSSETVQEPDSLYRGGSDESTPRQRKSVRVEDAEDNMFDPHIMTSATIADRYQQKPPSPTRNVPSSHKIMNAQQFERYRQDQERLKSVGGFKKDDDEEDADVYDDDEDEAEKNRQMAKQRRKQEAHMAVYRQQMMKVTGETTQPMPPSRPSMIASQSTPNLSLGVPGALDDEDGEDDEEVPLAILAAHGFPNKHRAPGRLSSMSSNPNLRASTMQLGTYPPPTGSVAGGDVGGHLPVFARNLPQDPYFGAGLVNSAARESLAYGTGAASVHSGPTRGSQSGGLVGVIADEERSRAMRRGSPNAQGEYSLPPPSNGFSGTGFPPIGRGMITSGSNGMPVLGTMPMNSTDEAQMIVVQQMQQFMQMQMQFMQMMSTGGSQAGSPVAGELPRSGTLGNLAVPQGGLRPGSQQGQQRTMSSLDPNAAPWMQQLMNRPSTLTPSVQGHGNQYAPSIAPSERSNIGQPGRYRPVSYFPPEKSRTNTMSAADPNWTVSNQIGVNQVPSPLQVRSNNKQNTADATIKAVKKNDAEDEDDDEDDDEAGWEKMKAKRDKKKDAWRSKKERSSMMGF